MRRGICFLMVLPVLLGAVPAAAAGEEGFDLGCTAAVLMERQTGTVLYAKGEHERLPPASVTKVMTLLLIAEAVDVPVVASGGAGKPEHLVTVFREAKADAAIVAGMIHSGDYTISDIKAAMCAAGVPTRMSW